MYRQPGDLVEWCFTSMDGTSKGVRSKQGPRRVGIAVASVSSPKVCPPHNLSSDRLQLTASPVLVQIIGRALSFAKRGETLDVLLKM